MNNSYILRAVMETPWAILPAKLAVILEVAQRHAAGERLTAEEIQAQVNGAQRPPDRSAGSVAVLPLFGTLIPRANLITESSGGTSAERYGKAFRAALADTNVGAIVLDVDSPGGAVPGIEELSADIFKARGQKPIVAVANHLAASAAYWIATAADELVVSPSAEVGSIGVFAAHEDFSQALEQAGIKVSLIAAGKFKVEGNPYEPLGDEARAAIQSRVDEYYDSFVKAVARNRGVGVSDVREGFGEGRVVGAKEAVKLGMADRIGTLDETIARLARGAPRSPRGPSADLEYRQRRLRLAQY
jgi:signal peptide peptidase SppA